MNITHIERKIKRIGTGISNKTTTTMELNSTKGIRSLKDVIMKVKVSITKAKGTITMTTNIGTATVAVITDSIKERKLKVKVRRIL